MWWPANFQRGLVRVVLTLDVPPPFGLCMTPLSPHHPCRMQTFAFVKGRPGHAAGVVAATRSCSGCVVGAAHLLEGQVSAGCECIFCKRQAPHAIRFVRSCGGRPRKIQTRILYRKTRRATARQNIPEHKQLAGGLTPNWKRVFFFIIIIIFLHSFIQETRNLGQHHLNPS